jgi:hypothetical protein
MSPLMLFLVKRTLDIIRSTGIEPDSGGHEPFLCVIDGRISLRRAEFVQFARQVLAQ